VEKVSIKQEGRSVSHVAGVDALSGRPVAASFGETIEDVAPGEETGGALLAPGFIDLQVNGFAGVDFNDPAAPEAAIARAIRELFACGVTRFLPTVITGAPEDMLGSFRNLAAAKERIEEGEAIEGFHVEGPHISAEDGPRGAHPRRWVRRPDLHEFHRMQDAAGGLIRVVTLSPEWPEAPRYIEGVIKDGTLVSIGHTNATTVQIADAVSAGATMSTHLGNGAHQMLPRHPNYVWEQLAEDRLTAGFIVDGIHLGRAFLTAALRAKGPGRRLLVTDAAAPAGCAPGRYRLGEQEVELTADERVLLVRERRLAGSALRMNRGVANLMRLGGLSLAEAVAMATVNPARAAAIEGRQAGLVTGERGDVVEFTAEDGDIRVQRTWVAGRLVYSAA
jgi:N-acetylglucosamine-6-phosphate deacetylase